MTLPSGSQISFNNLRVELGISTQAPFSITSASTGLYVAINTNSPDRPNSSAPHAISEWWNYNHNAAACNTFSGFETTGITSLADCFTGLHGSSVYSTCGSLTVGCVVYQSTGCTNIFGTTFIQGGDGTNYELTGGTITATNNPFC